MEFAVDPNGDGKVKDRVNLINMSLGSDYGQPFDDDLSAAVEHATHLGILTVAAAGNGSDKPYVAGTPAGTDSALSVAQTAVPSAFLQLMQILAPPAIAGNVYTGTCSSRGLGAGAVLAIHGRRRARTAAAARRVSHRSGAAFARIRTSPIPPARSRSSIGAMCSVLASRSRARRGRGWRPDRADRARRSRVSAVEGAFERRWRRLRPRLHGQSRQSLSNRHQGPVWRSPVVVNVRRLERRSASRWAGFDGRLVRARAAARAPRRASSRRSAPQPGASISATAGTGNGHRAVRRYVRALRPWWRAPAGPRARRRRAAPRQIRRAIRPATRSGPRPVGAARGQGAAHEQRRDKHHLQPADRGLSRRSPGSAEVKFVVNRRGEMPRWLRR